MKELVKFRFWIAGGVAGILVLYLVVYEQHRSVEKYQRHRAEYCATFAASPEKQKECEENGRNSRDYLPWWYALIVWPEGVTTWAIIGTGVVIAWQALETRKAAVATENASHLALCQINLTKEKERARLEVTAGTALALEELTESWYLTASVQYAISV